MKALQSLAQANTHTRTDTYTRTHTIQGDRQDKIRELKKRRRKKQAEDHLGEMAFLGSRHADTPRAAAPDVDRAARNT